jgi:hypothetical protein
VLNLFAEREHAFWNFWPYTSLLASETRFHFPALSRDRVNQTHSVLARLIKQAGHKKKSDFASRALGSWANTPQFNPYDIPTELRRLYFRHLSIVVPKADRDAVQSHFEQQANCFGNSALIPCPEISELGVFDDLVGTMHWKLLYYPIVKTNAEDRVWLYDEVRKYQSAEALSVLAASLDPRFAIKGLFDLFCVPTRFVPFVEMDRYAEVLRFRVRLALVLCPLPQIEKLALILSSHDAILGEYPEGIREELLEMLKNRLEPYRSILEFKFPSELKGLASN